ncbi:non-homologous end-joining DNA ligase [Actinomycetes bacterium KLBMP 9759]
MPGGERGGPAGPGALIRPMLATAGAIPTGSGWAFEIKFDGVRAIAYTGDRRARLFSRNDRDVTTSYPDVAMVLDTDATPMVLDGELVALDDHGRSDFGLLQQRMHVMKPTAALIAAVPVTFAVFDVLQLDGRSLLDLPYAQRRSVLVDLGLSTRGVVVPPNFVDIAGQTVMDAASAQGLEGIVAKRLNSTYQPGRRTRSWIKTPIRHTAEVVIAGWAASSGNHAVLSSLLLAAHSPGGELVYVGDVGTGFTDAARRHLSTRLTPLERATPPFDGEYTRAHAWPGRPAGRGPVHWVDPRLVGEIEYRTFTLDRTTGTGGFRHPSWRGLRPDRSPSEVVVPAR